MHARQFIFVLNYLTSNPISVKHKLYMNDTTATFNMTYNIIFQLDWWLGEMGEIRHSSLNPNFPRDLVQ